MIDVAAVAARSVSAWDQPGTLAFLVIFGMGVILYFVFRSMSRHLRKIREQALVDDGQAEPNDAAAPRQRGRDHGMPAGPGAC